MVVMLSSLPDEACCYCERVALWPYDACCKGCAGTRGETHDDDCHHLLWKPCSLRGGFMRLSVFADMCVLYVTKEEMRSLGRV